MSDKRFHIAIVNGPNLNLLGKREPEIYGTMPFEEYLSILRSKYEDIEIDYYQSNHEGDLIDYLQQTDEKEDITGIVLNAGGYTHTSVALRDTVAAISKRVIEVHISDPRKRETFRMLSYLSDVAAATFAGFGLRSYDRGIDFLLSSNRK